MKIGAAELEFRAREKAQHECLVLDLTTESIDREVFLHRSASKLSMEEIGPEHFQSKPDFANRHVVKLWDGKTYRYLRGEGSLKWIWFDDEIPPPAKCGLGWFKDCIWIKDVRSFCAYIEDHGLPGFIDFDYHLKHSSVMDAIHWLQLWVEDNPELKLDDEFCFDCHSRDRGMWSKVLGPLHEIKDTLKARGFKPVEDGNGQNLHAS